MTDDDKRLKVNAKMRAWRKKNWQKVLKARRKCYAKNSHKYLFKLRRDWFRKRYGITLEQLSELLTRHCEICGSDKQKKIDHDHSVKSPHYRGVLCNSCNLLLGKIEAIGIANFSRYLNKKAL